MNTEQARAVVEGAIRSIVPDAEFSDLEDSTKLREWFELDSLDFLAVIETITQQTAVTITEDDYAALTTMDGFMSFLADRAA